MNEDHYDKDGIPYAMPKCFGVFDCLDDCVVSCAYWEECMEASNSKEGNDEDDEEG